MEEAIHTLSQVSREPEGAQAVLDAKAADYIPLLLENKSTKVLERTCRLLDNLISHESTAPAILELNICPMVASLLP